MRLRRVVARAVAVGVTGVLVGAASAVPASAQDVNLCTQFAQLDVMPDYCETVGQVDDLLLTIDGLEDAVDTPDAQEIAVDTANSVIGPILAPKCSPAISGPYKSGRYTVAVDAHAECDSEQTAVAVIVSLWVKRGGAWHKIGESNSGGSINSDHTDDVTSTGPCKPDTNRKYRGFGGTNDEDGKTKFDWGPVGRVRCPTAVEILSDPIKIDPDVR
jgi:hypothetical protein